MGLLNVELVNAHVSFAGITEYANSELEELPIRAQVEVSGADQLYQGKPALVTMLSLGACRMAEMLNREPQYMDPFMRLVGHLCDALLDGPPGSEFRVRDHVTTDSAVLAAWAQVSGDPTEAEVNGALPVVSEQLGGVEREAKLRLMMRKSGEAPWASFKFRLGSANPLTTIGTWSAALEHCVREYPYDQIAGPIAAALSAVYAGWAALGEPPVIPAEPMALLKGAAIAVSIHDDPIQMAATMLAGEQKDGQSEDSS